MGYMRPCLSKTKRKPKSFIAENSLSWFRKTQRRAEEVRRLVERRQDHTVKVSLGYIANLMQAWAT